MIATLLVVYGVMFVLLGLNFLYFSLCEKVSIRLCQAFWLSVCGGAVAIVVAGVLQVIDWLS